jgi:hypothetical protein
MPDVIAADDQVYAQIAALREGPPTPLALRVDAVIHDLETEPGQRHLRRHLFPTEQGPVWGADVRAGDDDWIVLWRDDTAASGVIALVYVGPATFTR